MEKMPILLLTGGFLLWCMVPPVVLALIVRKHSSIVIGEGLHHDGGSVFPRLLSLVGALVGAWLVVTSAILRVSLLWLPVKYDGANAADVLTSLLVVGVMMTVISTAIYRHTSRRWKR